MAGIQRDFEVAWGKANDHYTGVIADLGRDYDGKVEEEQNRYKERWGMVASRLKGLER